MTANTPRNRSLPRGAGLGLTLAATLVLGAAGSFWGCTSETQNLVGVGLPGGQRDSLLVPLKILNEQQVTAFGNIRIPNEDVPFDEHELLFFGNQEGESSAILVQYDFEAFRDSFSFVDLLESSSQDDIKIQLFLYMINYYEQLQVDCGEDITCNLSNYYWVRELDEPLAPELYSADGSRELPGFGTLPINPGFEQLVFSQSNLFLTLSTSRFMEWFSNGFHNGLIIMPGEGIEPADPGILGFAAKDFDTSRHSSNLALENINTTVGPILHIEISRPDDDPVIANLVPLHDLSTLEAISEPSDFPESMVVRTHLRSYPYLSFSLAELPPNVLINRAVIGLFNRTDDSFGPVETVVIAELDSSVAPGGDLVIPLNEIATKARPVVGRVNLTPAEEELVEFNISSSLQRYINGAYDEPIRYLVAAAENFFTSYASGADPSFFFQRFVFDNPTDPASERKPYLKITYTQDSALGEAKR